MAQHTFSWIGRVLLCHPYVTGVIGFLAPIAFAYWLFGVAPYTRARTDRLLSPWPVRRPTVPGVLERYASWEWAAENSLTPFGRWLFEELAQQDRTLFDLARDTGLEIPTVAPALFRNAPWGDDAALVRRLAMGAGADDEQIDRLLRDQWEASREMNRLP
jgi:hypothetical protein